MFNDGPSWKEHRNFVTHEFRKFGFGNQSIEQRIQIVVDEYLHEISVSQQQFQTKDRWVLFQMGPHFYFSHLNWKRTEGRAHDPHPNIATAIYNIIWTSISGEKFSWDDPFLRKLIDNLETNLQAVELTGPHNYVTILRYILPYNVDILTTPLLLKMKNLADDWSDFFLRNCALFLFVSTAFGTWFGTTLCACRWSSSKGCPILNSSSANSKSNERKCRFQKLKTRWCTTIWIKCKALKPSANRPIFPVIYHQQFLK